jgi:hypothetical protein
MREAMSFASRRRRDADAACALHKACVCSRMNGKDAWRWVVFSRELLTYMPKRKVSITRFRPDQCRGSPWRSEEQRQRMPTCLQPSI